MSKEKQIPVSEELLLEEIRVILKDYFVASIRKAGDELRIRFAGGETYCLTVWKQSSQKRRGRGAHMRANEINFGEGACPTVPRQSVSVIPVRMFLRRSAAKKGSKAERRRFLYRRKR